MTSSRSLCSNRSRDSSNLNDRRENDSRKGPVDLVTENKMPTPDAHQVNAKPAVRFLKEVAVPVMRHKETLLLNQRSSKSPSSTSSVFSSRCDLSGEYDTPGTSVTATPAAFSLEGRKARVSISKSKTNENISIAKLKSERPLKLTKGKQKRPPSVGLAEGQMDSDIRLAKVLQAEEFGEAPAPNLYVSKRRFSKVEDSEDESGSLSEICSDSGTDVSIHTQSVEISQSPAKRTKVGGHASLPSRAARNIARKSIAEKVLVDLMDDGDNVSDLSDYYCSIDSEGDIHDSDDSEDLLDSTNSETGTTVHAARRVSPRRRRRNPRLDGERRRREADGVHRSVVMSRVSLKSDQ